MWLPLAAALALTACGGGSDDSPATPPVQGVTLSGTAAMGAALAGATVEAKCNGSSGSTTTAANGSYTLVLTSGSLPCALRVTPLGGGVVLHSIAQGGSTAHLTQVSHLVVASLAGDDPANYYGAFSDSVAGFLTVTAVQGAKARVVATLKFGGADFSTVGDVLSAPLVAGNLFDQALAALAQRMAVQGVTLSALTVAVHRASPNNTTPTPGTVALPPEALLQPASATCNSLRSGLYRVVMPKASNAGEYATATVSFDAVAGTFATTNVGGSFNGQFTSTGACSYSLSNGGQMVVSQAGLVIMRTLEDGASGNQRLVIAFPEQTHTLAELSGDWQSMGFEHNDAGTAYGAQTIAWTVSANGAVGVTSVCPGVATCTTFNPPVSVNFTVLPTGGFGLSNTVDTEREPVFAYRAGNGDLMLIGIANNGSFGLWTPQRTNGLPVLNTRGLTWGIWLNALLRPTPTFSQSDFDTTALDPATMSYTRVSRTDGHSETLSVNQPRNGLYYRAAGTATATIGPTAGNTVTINEFTSLPLRGMGVSALSMPSLFYAAGVPVGGYFLSVTQP